MKAILTSFILILFISGCATVEVKPYQISAENIQTLKKYNIKFNVGEFTAKKSDVKIQCRAASKIVLPHGVSFERYIEDALISELKFANLYSIESPITISGYLNDTDASSSFTSKAYWLFDIVIRDNHGHQFRTRYKREYDASWIGATACFEDMPNAFNPTIKGLINDIINNPEFEQMLKIDSKNKSL